ncbi:MAG: AAA family ATPase, partial [Alkalispirochaeta sp.]
MEKGGTTILRVARSLPPLETNWKPRMELWLQAVRAIGEVTSTGVIHHCLTSESFAVGSDNRIVLVDGRSAPARIDDLSGKPDSTWCDSILAAPEQTTRSAAAVDERTIVYNLGVLGWMILTDRAPYGYTAEADRETSILRSPVQHGTPQLAEPLIALIEAATEKTPSRRCRQISDLDAGIVVALSSRRIDDSTGTSMDSPPLGREPEITRILSLIDPVSFQVIALLGEAGIGKTTIREYLVRRLRRQNASTVFWTRGAQHGGVPYAAIGSLVAELVARHEETIIPILQSCGSATLNLLRRISRAIAAITVAEDETEDSLSPRLGDVIAQILNRIGGVVVVFDDLQWMDRESITVIHQLIASAPAAVFLLLGRPEASSLLPPDVPITRVPLSGLSDADSHELLSRVVTHATDPTRRHHVEHATETILSQARGNPLAILSLARAAALTASDETIPVGSDTSLVDLAMNRLSRVDWETRTVLSALALLSPPVSEEVLATVSLPVCREKVYRRDALDEAYRAMLIDLPEEDHRKPADRKLQFVHDTVEAAVRKTALQDHSVVRAVVAALERILQTDDERSLFAAAALIADHIELTREDTPNVTLPPETTPSILYRAAQQAISRRAADAAWRYSRTALRLHESDFDPKTRLHLHEIAHEAAFLRDDIRGMSRHFQVIRRRADLMRRNRARQLWVTRAFAAIQHERAIWIGLVILRDLGTVVPVNPTAAELRRATQELAQLRWTAPVARIRRAPKNTNATALLAVNTCVYLIAPVIVSRQDLFPFLILTMLRISLKHGRSPQTSLAFLYWAIMDTHSTNRRRRVVRLGRAALELARQSGTTQIRTTAEVACRIFTEHWGRELRGLLTELLPLGEEARNAGNTEWAFHAFHLHVAMSFIAGAPLPDLYAQAQPYFSDMRLHGFERSQSAVGLYLQMMESLLGLTPNPLELTGSWFTESEMMKRYDRLQDQLGLWAIHYMRATLAMYADRPHQGISHIEQAWTMAGGDHALPEVPVIAFMTAVLGWRTGKTELAQQATRAMRVWNRDGRGNFRHRYSIIRAERARATGRRRLAVHHYRHGISAAIDGRFIHEAGLAAERLGDLLHEMSRSGRPPRSGRRHDRDARNAWYQAYGLYSQWGVPAAVDRIRRRLGWSRLSRITTKPLPEQSIISRIAETHPVDSGLKAILAECVRISAPEQAYFRARFGNTDYLYEESGTGTTRIQEISRQSLPPRINDALFMETRQPSEVFQDEAEATIIIDSRESIDPVELRVVLSRRRMEMAFSPAILDDVRNVLRAAAIVLRVRLLANARDEQHRQLIVADRLSSIGILAASTAHEVGNPNYITQLNVEALSATLAAARSEGDVPTEFLDTVSHFAEEIRDAGNRIGEVVRTITEYGRGGRSTELELSDPNAVLRTATRFSRILVSQYTSRFEVRELADGRLVWAVPGQLEQAIINLIKNACEALTDQSQMISVPVTLNTAANNVRFSVS